MTTEQKYQAVAQAIRKVLPRMMEISEGCILKRGDEKIKIFTQQSLHYWLAVNTKTKEIERIDIDLLDNIKIIGKEPMLNDVLEWINKTSSDTVILKEDTLILYDDFLNYARASIKIDLSKPYLKDQSEELINFLYELIK